MKVISFALVLALLLLSTSVLAEESSNRKAPVDASRRTEAKEPGEEAERTDALRPAQKMADSQLNLVTAPVPRGSEGDVPGLMSYQGLLTDDDGLALDTTVSITFSIYKDSTGGQKVWSETQSNVAVTNGLFDVQMGRMNSIPDSVFKDPGRWLGIKVGAYPELQPRQRIAAVGYAFRAEVANSVAPAPVDTVLIDMICDLLIWSGDSVAAIYADTTYYGPGDLSRAVNDFAYSYWDKFDLVLQHMIDSLDPGEQQIPQLILDSTRVWAPKDLDAYAASLDSAYAAGDTLRLRQFDAETRKHSLDRVSSVSKEVAVIIAGQLKGDSTKGWLWDKAKALLLDLIDKVLEDIPSLGSALKKVAGAAKAAAG